MAHSDTTGHTILSTGTGGRPKRDDGPAESWKDVKFRQPAELPRSTSRCALHAAAFRSHQAWARVFARRFGGYRAPPCRPGWPWRAHVAAPERTQAPPTSKKQFPAPMTWRDDQHQKAGGRALCRATYLPATLSCEPTRSCPRSHPEKVHSAGKRRMDPCDPRNSPADDTLLREATARSAARWSSHFRPKAAAHIPYPLGQSRNTGPDTDPRPRCVGLHAGIPPGSVGGKSVYG